MIKNYTIKNFKIQETVNVNKFKNYFGRFKLFSMFSYLLYDC